MTELAGHEIQFSPIKTSEPYCRHLGFESVVIWASWLLSSDVLRWLPFHINGGFCRSRPWRTFYPSFSLKKKWTWAALDVLHAGRAPCWTEALDYTSFCLNVSLWLLLLVVLWRPLHNLGQKHWKVCWPQQIPLPLFHQNQPTAICLDPASWLMRGLPSCPLKPSPSFFWSTQALPWPMPDWMTC